MDGQYCRQLSDQGKRAIVCTAAVYSSAAYVASPSVYSAYAAPAVVSTLLKK